MDCEKANKGLFSGLLVAVVTLIAIATFFVFDSRLNNPMTAIKVCTGSPCCCLVERPVCVCVCVCAVSYTHLTLPTSSEV